MGPDVSKEAHEDEKYNKMDDTDQLDVKQDICDNICWCGYHKCFNDDEDNELKGINVAKLREDYENSLQEVFQCEVCNCKIWKILGTTSCQIIGRASDSNAGIVTRKSKPFQNLNNI